MGPVERESRKRKCDGLRLRLRCIDKKINELWLQERQIITEELHRAGPGLAFPSFSEDPTSDSDGEERKSSASDKTESHAEDKKKTVFTVAKTGHVVTLEATRFTAEQRIRLNRICLQLMSLTPSESAESDNKK
ncbi:unnamed protein product, partial [Mesorhabditis spiculigera]